MPIEFMEGKNMKTIEMPVDLLETMVFLLEDFYGTVENDCVAETEGEEACNHCVLNTVFDRLHELHKA